MTFLTRLLVVALHALANASFAQTGDAARAAVSRLPLPGERWADIPRFRRDRDRAMIDMLRSIGIEKGKPFNPDAKAKSALKAGVLEAQAWLEAKYDAGLPPFYEGGRWTMPANPEMMEAVKVDFNDPEKYPVEGSPIPMPISASSVLAPRSSTSSASGTGRRPVRWRQELSSECATEPADRAILVGDGL